MHDIDNGYLCCVLNWSKWLNFDIIVNFVLGFQGSRNHGGKGGTGPPNILTGGALPLQFWTLTLFD